MFKKVKKLVAISLMLTIASSMLIFFSACDDNEWRDYYDGTYTLTYRSYDNGSQEKVPKKFTVEVETSDAGCGNLPDLPDDINIKNPKDENLRIKKNSNDYKSVTWKNGTWHIHNLKDRGDDCNGWDIYSATTKSLKPYTTTLVFYVAKNGNRAMRLDIPDNGHVSHFYFYKSEN